MIELQVYIILVLLVTSCNYLWSGLGCQQPIISSFTLSKQSLGMGGLSPLTIACVKDARFLTKPKAKVIRGTSCKNSERKREREREDILMIRIKGLTSYYTPKYHSKTVHIYLLVELFSRNHLG